MDVDTIKTQKEPKLGENITFSGHLTDEFKEILSSNAVDFLTGLHRKFNNKRITLLNSRKERQKKIDAGMLPNFLSNTEEIRNSDWKVSSTPEDLQDRRVEITGPVDRKMIINALNSGVKVFMADFEDSNSPTWENNLNGQINLRDAVNRSISFINPNGKIYKLNENTATLMVRPRGWHLNEKHMTVDGEPMSASLFDFGLYFYHNVKTLLENGTGPYFYLPKLESHLEARLWNDVFNFAQDELNIQCGTIKVTVLIEHILAAFEMDEILFELKEHIVGLNCGRWDYIFSFIKKFRNNPNFILPDRGQVTMDRHFMKSYVNLLIQTCHSRGAHAMGGMAAQIPIKHDEDANNIAMDKVKEDKKREANAGHDGTWIAHPGLAPIALDAFNSVMADANQLNNLRVDVQVTAEDLLKVPSGEITEDGIRANIRVGVQYVEAWIRGNGCVPLYNLMEDAATAEISRTQLWQWLHHTAELNDGRLFTQELLEKWLLEELTRIQNEIGDELYKNGQFSIAANLLKDMILSDEFDEFLTLPAYELLQ